MEGWAYLSSSQAGGLALTFQEFLDLTLVETRLLMVHVTNMIDQINEQISSQAAAPPEH